MASVKDAVSAHPAGTTAGVGGPIVGLIVSNLHLTPDQAGLVIAIGGLFISAVSYAAAHGGIKGLWNEVIHGTPGA